MNATVIEPQYKYSEASRNQEFGEEAKWREEHSIPSDEIEFSLETVRELEQRIAPQHWGINE